MSDTDNAPLVGMPALEDAFLHYREQGLRIPPVQHTLVPLLEERTPGVYSTAPMSIEDRAGLIALAADPAAADQVGFGHLGHGVSSWFYCCRLLTASLAAYVRLSYGSAYVEDGSDADAVNAALMRLEELVVAAKDAAESGKLAPGERMIVVLDALEGNFWRPGRQPERPSDDPLDDAQNWLLESQPG